VVWAVRRSRPDGGTATGFAALYYWIMRRLVGMAEMPRQGADFFLIDATVIRAFREFRERNTSVLALITWMGFRQAFVDYDKQERRAGRSGWTLQKKIKLVIDSVTSFSEFPIRWCSYAGAGLLASALLLLAAVVGGVLPVSGGVGAVLVVLVGLTGVQLVALGVVGEYVWRALDEARRRPLYVVEAAVGREPVKVQ
jgi:dolichol-phosphate mannosyltransferase